MAVLLLSNHQSHEKYHKKKTWILEGKKDLKKNLCSEKEKQTGWTGATPPPKKRKKPNKTKQTKKTFDQRIKQQLSK